jgi:hypothetical protein
MQKTSKVKHLCAARKPAKIAPEKQLPDGYRDTRDCDCSAGMAVRHFYHRRAQNQAPARSDETARPGCPFGQLSTVGRRRSCALVQLGDLPECLRLRAIFWCRNESRGSTEPIEKGM